MSTIKNIINQAVSTIKSLDVSTKAKIGVGSIIILAGGAAAIFFGKNEDEEYAVISDSVETPDIATEEPEQVSE